MDNTFQQSAAYYDIDQRPDHDDDIPFYMEQARHFGSPVLELACGTGRIAIPLAQQNIPVVGVDISKAMLSVFENKLKELSYDTQKNITCKQGDMTNFSFDTLFSLILLPFHSFQALTSDEQVKNCLACIHHHLTDEGAFIINVFHQPTDIAEHWKKGLETLETATFLDNGEFVAHYTVFHDLDTQHQIMHYDDLYRVYQEENAPKEYRDNMHIRYYYGDDLRQRLLEAGFTIKKEFGWYDGSPVEEEQELIFICQKRKGDLAVHQEDQ